MKKIFLIIILAFALGVIAWYLISPAFTVIQANDASPFADQIDDALSTMSNKEKREFNAEVTKMADQVMDKSEHLPSEPRIVSEGEFMEAAHHVEGSALFIETPTGRILRFEDFDTINGPNLHIYLASDLSDDDIIDLGPIRATTGDVNYELPDGVDLDHYNKVLVWCVPFRVLFSFADLE